TDIGDTTFGVALADMNSDGKLDLAVGGDLQNSIFLGNGDGTFGTRIDYSGGGPVALADLNADGNVDLVEAHFAYGGSVRLGNGDGSFGARLEFPLGYFVRDIVVEDMNGDGALDVITDRAVLPGRGDGTLGPPLPFLTAERFPFVAVGDLN